MLAERGSLTSRIRRIETRLAAPVAARPGRVRGYPTRAQRHAKTVRTQTLRTRLTVVQRQLDSGVVSVCRGGRSLLRTRHNLTAANLRARQVPPGAAAPQRGRGASRLHRPSRPALPAPGDPGVLPVRRRHATRPHQRQQHLRRTAPRRRHHRTARSTSCAPDRPAASFAVATLITWYADGCRRPRPAAGAVELPQTRQPGVHLLGTCSRVQS
jgi:hypothetical protein